MLYNNLSESFNLYPPYVYIFTRVCFIPEKIIVCNNNLLFKFNLISMYLEYLKRL